MIQIKRVYEKPEAADGKRYLIDRMWPRGIKKETLQIEGWLKQVAPSHELRKWFSHDPEKFAEFRDRYRMELQANEEVLLPILEEAKDSNVTFLFAARDMTYNHAVVFKEFLNEKLKKMQS